MSLEKNSYEVYWLPDPRSSKPGGKRDFLRMSTDARNELDLEYRARGYEKEYFQLTNGQRGFRWR